MKMCIYVSLHIKTFTVVCVCICIHWVCLFCTWIVKNDIYKLERQGEKKPRSTMAKWWMREMLDELQREFWKKNCTGEWREKNIPNHTISNFPNPHSTEPQCISYSTSDDFKFDKF